MSADVRLGGSQGIDVRVNAGWFALAALVAALLALRYFPISLPGQPPRVYWALGAAGAIVLFLSIVAHELAHVLVARTHGVASRSISLDILGGRAEVSAALPSAGPEMLMALGGPAANALIALIAALILTGTAAPPEVAALLRFAAVINALLAAVNMLPVLPLDGGRLLRALIWSLTGSIQRSTYVAARIGSGFAVGVIVLGALAALADHGFVGLLAAAVGMYLLRRSVPFLRQPSSAQLP